MITMQNQSVGSFDDQTHEYVEVSFDETMVQAFAFHSVGTHGGGPKAAYHRVHGISVEARFVFAAIKAFANCQLMAVAPDGQKFFVTWVIRPADGTEELRAGGKWGKVVARMRRTGYVQQPQREVA
jgi:hypothetical protein